MNKLQSSQIELKSGEIFKANSNVSENIVIDLSIPRVKMRYPKPTNIPSVQFEPFPLYKKRIKTEQLTPSPLYREENIKFNRLVRFPDE